MNTCKNCDGRKFCEAIDWCKIKQERLSPEGSSPASSSRTRVAGRKLDATTDHTTAPPFPDQGWGWESSYEKHPKEAEWVIGAAHDLKVRIYSWTEDFGWNVESDMSAPDPVDWMPLPPHPRTQSVAGWSGGGLLSKTPATPDQLKGMPYPNGPESLIDRGRREERSGSGNARALLPGGTKND